MSVRDDRAARAATACSAWMPQPVPRSSARLARVAHGHLGERGRGAADAEHVVGAQRAAGRELAEVGGDPPVDRPRRRRRPRRGAGRRGRGPRRPGPAPAAATSPSRAAPSARRASGSARSSAARRTGTPSSERPHEGRDAVAGARRARGAAARHGLLAVQRGGGDRAEQVLDALDGVPGGAQVVAQRGDEGGIGLGCHRVRRRESQDPPGHHPCRPRQPEAASGGSPRRAGGGRSRPRPAGRRTRAARTTRSGVIRTTSIRCRGSTAGKVGGRHRRPTQVRRNRAPRRARRAAR